MRYRYGAIVALVLSSSIVVFLSPAVSAQDGEEEQGVMEPNVLTELDAIDGGWTDNAQLIVAVTPAEETSTGLRSVELHVALFPREPHAVWSDGTPVTADVQIPAEEMMLVVERLQVAGAFIGARRYHSRYREDAEEPSFAGSTEGPPEVPEGPLVTIELIVLQGDWHRYWLANWPLGGEAKAGVEVIRAAVEGEAAALIDQILAQIPSD